jgi:hypothetical protein
LDPHHLQVLSIPLTPDSGSFFISNGNPSLGPFPFLHALELEVGEEALQLLPMLLSKTPKLRSLKLFPGDLFPENYMLGLVSPPTCPIPSLEEYYGPHKLLPIALGRAMGSPSAHLRRLFLKSVDENDPVYAFVNSIQSCHPLQLRVLTHIHISVLESMDLKSLAGLQDMFPVLQVFHLHASEKVVPSGLSCEFSEISLTIDATPLFLYLYSISTKRRLDGFIYASVAEHSDISIDPVDLTSGYWGCAQPRRCQG